MASGLDWNSEEEGTAGADALKVEDLIELSEGNSGQSTQARPSGCLPLLSSLTTPRLLLFIKYAQTQ